MTYLTRRSKIVLQLLNIPCTTLTLIITNSNSLPSSRYVEWNWSIRTWAPNRSSGCSINQQLEIIIVWILKVATHYPRSLHDPTSSSFLELLKPNSLKMGPPPSFALPSFSFVKALIDSILPKLLLLKRSWNTSRVQYINQGKWV